MQIEKGEPPYSISNDVFYKGGIMDETVREKMVRDFAGSVHSSSDGISNAGYGKRMKEWKRREHCREQG